MGIESFPHAKDTFGTSGVSLQFDTYWGHQQVEELFAVQGEAVDPMLYVPGPLDLKGELVEASENLAPAVAPKLVE
eukprot:6614722-Pyramimonas_sp.AAC.1